MDRDDLLIDILFAVAITVLGLAVLILVAFSAAAWLGWVSL